MRTIRGLIMKEDERFEPFDCPAEKTKANCLKCNYRVGRVRVNYEESGPTVSCCWEEWMKNKKRKFMVVPANDLDELRSHNHRKTILAIEEIESDDD